MDMPQLYYDVVRFEEKKFGLARKEGDFEVTSTRRVIVGARAYRGGGWGVAFTEGEEANVEELVRKAIRVSNPGDRPLTEAWLWSGKIRVGEPPEDEEEFLREVIEEFSSMGCTEATATISEVKRVIKHPDTGLVAEEEKTIYELKAFVGVASKGGAGVASMSMSGSPVNVSSKALRDLFERASLRAHALASGRQLNPLQRGKWSVILSPEASGVFINGLARMLKAENPFIPLGERILPEGLSIYDDPLQPWSPSYSTFDDEGVECSKRILIDGGIVVDYLHTRETGGSPGNARGLTQAPESMQFTLGVSPGDWRHDEIIQETRRGMYVDGVSRVEVKPYSRVVKMNPLACWLIERGEVKEPVLAESVSIPIPRSTNTINAVGRYLEFSYGHESGQIVSGVAPPIRLLAYIN